MKIPKWLIELLILLWLLICVIMLTMAVIYCREHREHYDFIEDHSQITDSTNDGK